MQNTDYQFILDIIKELISFIKYLFSIHWLLGSVVLLLIIGAIVYLFYLAIAALIIYFIYQAFAHGHYILGGIGIAVLVIAGVAAYFKEKNNIKPNIKDNHEQVNPS